MQRSRSRKLAATGERPRTGYLPLLVKKAGPCVRRAGPWVRRAPIAAAIVAAIHSAQAQEAVQEPGGLSEVVVTASKRAENLQDVPISVTALNTEALEQQHIQHFTDYAQALPTVAFQSLQPGFARTFMRGIASDNNPNHSGPLPSVGTYLDEQPITTIQGPLDLHMYDIQRVEVLPGPQGTLYGASSEAGTIRIITNKPDPKGFAAGYDIQTNVIKNGTVGAIGEGFVNIPLAPNAAVRLVGWYERDSGYLDNVRGTLTYPQTPNPPSTNCGGVTPTCSVLDNKAVAGDHYNPTDTYGARAALKVDLNDNWTISPTIIAQRTKWGGIFAEEDWKALDAGSPLPNDLSVRHFYPEGGKDSWFDAALTVEGKIGDFDLTYAGAWLKRTDHTSSDYSDYSLAYESYAAYWPNNPTQVILGTDRYQMFSNELRITSPQQYPVRFVGGLFQQRQQHNIEQNYIINGLDPTYWVGAGTNNQWPGTWWLTEQQRVNRDTAVFGEANWDITSKLTLTAGIRRFHYKNTLEGFYGFGLNAFGSNPDLIPPSGLDAAGIGASSGQQICFNNTPFHGAPCSDLNKRSDGSGWTPKFNLSYKIDAERMIYVTYSKGFRPGGVNRIGTAAPYAADFLKNYEFGWKTSWLNNHLRFNGALYYEKWDNFQFSFLGPNSVTIVANAGQAKVKGAEAELEWAATTGLTFTAGAAYIDAYLSQNYCGALNPDGSPVTSNPCPPDSHHDDAFAPLAPSGQQLPTTPKFKGSIGARYAWSLAGNYQAYVQGNFMYQSAVWSDLRTIERNILGQQGSYGLTNLSVGVNKDNWTAELLVKNAFDVRASQYRYAECTQATCGPIAVYNGIAPPRLIGLQWSQRFGK
jgi:outer membrane receptor protein involved in Fe transport